MGNVGEDHKAMQKVWAEVIESDEPVTAKVVRVAVRQPVINAQHGKRSFPLNRAVRLDRTAV